MSTQHIHEALQLTAVAMLFALGIAIVMRGLAVMHGSILEPSAVILFVLGSYLISKGVKHTWFTEQMIRSMHGDQEAFKTHLWVPICIDVVLIALASVVVFLSAKPSLGRLAGPVVALAILTVLGVGAMITNG